MSKPMIEELVRLVEIHDLHPVIAKSFEWKDAKQAFELMLNQTEIGKIVIKV